MNKIFVIILVGVFFITGCGKNEQLKDPIEEDNVAIIDDQQIGVFNIKSFSVNYDEEDKLSYIYFEVENTSDEEANISTITYSLYKNNVLVISIPENLQGPIEVGGIRTITTSLDLNLSDVDKVIYEVK